LSAWEAGTKYSWLEAVHLTAALLVDPNSLLQAQENNWKHPASYEFMVLADIYDVLVMSNSKRKQKPRPRPWPNPGKQRLGRSKNLSRSDVLERLKKMNPAKE
jgi:hypothetical protein